VTTTADMWIIQPCLASCGHWSCFFDPRAKAD